MSSIATCPACATDNQVRTDDEIVTCTSCQQPFAPARIARPATATLRATWVAW